MKHKEAHIQHKIYLEDTDAGGIVYHANYLKFMERARTEWIGLYGLNRSYILEKKVIFVVRKIDISYRRAAFLDDEIVASAAVLELTKYAVIFAQQVIRTSDDKLLCDAKVQVVSTDQQSGKLIPLPDIFTTNQKRAES